MTSYVELSISNREDIPDLCVESLTLVKSLDQAVQGIEGAMDATLNEVKSRERISKAQLGELATAKELAQQINEIKAQVAVANYDLLDRSVRMIDDEIQTIEKAMEMSEDERLRKAVASRHSSGESQAQGFGGQIGGQVDMWVDFDDLRDNDMANVDPNEPVYCFCRQVCFGDMIACDNDECAIEWFHYGCVNLTKQPRNKWLCPDCSKKKR